MSGVTGESIKGQAQAIFGSPATTDAEKARAEHVTSRRYVTWKCTDTGVANINVAEEVIFRASTAGRIISACLTTPVNVALNTTDYVTVPLKKRTAGGSATTMATINTATSATVEFLPEEYDIVEGSETFASGDVLTLLMLKAGAGKAMTGATNSLNVTLLIEEGT